MTLALIILAAFLVFSVPGDVDAQTRQARWTVSESGVVDVGNGIQISAISVERRSP